MAEKSKGTVNGYAVVDNTDDPQNQNNNTYQRDNKNFHTLNKRRADRNQTTMADHQKVLPSSVTHKTLTDMEVDFMFREPFIVTGYRLTNQPWSYYLASVYWLHNETLNVWTHAIGCICVLFRAVVLCFQLNGFHDPRTFPVVGFTLGCFLNNFLSASAHLLHSKSPRHHYILYILDYAGITFYNLGNGIGSMYSCSHPRSYAQMQGFFLPVVVAMSWFSFLACALARLRYKGHFEIERKLIMVAVLSATAAFIAWPMSGRYLDCMEETDCSLSSLNHITIVFVFFALDALTYTAHFPERWKPGRFDIWGHGHQWFHVTVMVTQQLQLHALHVDLVQLSRGGHVSIGLTSILLSFLCLGAVEAVSLWCLLPAIDAKVTDDAGHDRTKDLKSQ